VAGLEVARARLRVVEPDGFPGTAGAYPQVRLDEQHAADPRLIDEAGDLGADRQGDYHVGAAGPVAVELDPEVRVEVVERVDERVRQSAIRRTARDGDFLVLAGGGHTSHLSTTPMGARRGSLFWVLSRNHLAIRRGIVLYYNKNALKSQ
jgi:hypothetical protein